jgi:hypothetical protein
MVFTMACPNFKKGLKMVSGWAFRGLARDDPSSLFQKRRRKKE